MKTCRRCKHFNTYGLCKAATEFVSIITGMPFSVAMPVETMRYSEAYCGAEGRWHEAKFQQNDKGE